MIRTLRRLSSFSLLVSIALTAAAQSKMDSMKPSEMDKMKTATERKPPESKPTTHSAKATVKMVDDKASVVTLTHDPIASLNWPAMTMNFKVRDRVLLKKLSVQKHVNVTIAKEGDDYVITAVE